MLRALAIAVVLFGVVVNVASDSAVAPEVEFAPVAAPVAGARTGWAAFAVIDVEVDAVTHWETARSG